LLVQRNQLCWTVETERNPVAFIHRYPFTILVRHQRLRSAFAPVGTLLPDGDTAVGLQGPSTLLFRVTCDLLSSLRARHTAVPTAGLAQGRPHAQITRNASPSRLLSREWRSRGHITIGAHPSFGPMSRCVGQAQSHRMIGGEADRVWWIANSVGLTNGENVSRKMPKESAVHTAVATRHDGSDGLALGYQAEAKRTQSIAKGENGCIWTPKWRRGRLRHAVASGTSRHSLGRDTSQSDSEAPARPYP
jgi:hypothetical protein